MNEEESALFKTLISSVQLLKIQPLSIQSEKFPFGKEKPQNSQVNLQWTQSYSQDDLASVQPDHMMIHPHYKFTAKIEDTPVFSHSAVFVLLFRVTDSEAFGKAMLSPEVKKVFFEKQIMKTMWPILRQQVLDGMTRLDFPCVPLPWMVE